MLAAVCHSYGPPEAVTVADIPTPAPAAGEVQVEIAAASVNFPDVLLVAGEYQVKVPPPFVVGSEFVGRVSAIGEGAQAFAVGDRVAATALTGAFAQFATVPLRSLQPVPSSVDDATGAAFGVAHRTAFHSLKSVAKVQEGDEVLVLGASGGVGLAAVELAALMGATVTAVASSSERLVAAASRGAGRVIDRTSADLRALLKTAVPQGFDVVIDPVGGTVAEPALRSVAWGGRYVVIGFASGHVPRLPLNLVLLKGAHVMGFEFRGFVEHAPREAERNDAELFDLLASGRVRPHIGATFALADAGKALRYVADGNAIGKVVIDIAGARGVNRPLPELNLSNRGFWTSGEDGVLRIDSCGDCGAMVHPPVPVCQVCRSTNRTQTAVSGKATVVGFTVNQHQWLPGMEPPYVIANVALDEDASVRLTTNIVDCEPGDVRVGLRVAVCFEHHDDVWLPLFAPTGEADAEPAVETPARRTPRAPLTTTRFEHQSVLTGIGRSQLGRRLLVNPLSLAVDACLQAIADAGLTVDDIDGLSTYPGAAAMGMSEGGVTAVEEALRIRPTWINGGGEIPGPAGSVIAAMLAVNAGLCRHVLCFRTVWESTHAALGMGRASTTGGGAGSGRVSGSNYEWRAPFGAMSAGNWIGMNANHYFHRYGATKEMLGWIALNGRANAERNPVAIYRDPMTMDDYMNARPITSPFGLYDCDVPCDGSIAVIVSAADYAPDAPHHAIRVESVGTQILERISWEQDTISHEPQVLGQCAHLWSRSSLTPADVDLALIYDGFTFNAISWIEALGFCELGEAKDWLDGGKRIALGGEVPVNPHGGQLSEGRTHGFGFIYEAVAQLRHAAGERQVANAEVAAVTSGGGTPSGVMLLTR